MTATPCAVPNCLGLAFITHPLPLCREDALTVSLNVIDILHANARSTSHPTETDVDRARVASNRVWDQPSHPPVVYFLTNGSRVKIGTSTNITARVSALSLRKPDAALLLQGGHDLEGTLHDHFADERIGNTEWFTLSPRIRRYIVARQHHAGSGLQQPLLPAEGSDQTVIPAPRRAVERKPSAAEKILETLKAFHEPNQGAYLHKDEIRHLTELNHQTLANTLSQLVKTNDIHRGPNPGEYGLGPAPATNTAE